MKLQANIRHSVTELQEMKHMFEVTGHTLNVLQKSPIILKLVCDNHHNQRTFVLQRFVELVKYSKHHPQTSFVWCSCYKKAYSGRKSLTLPEK